MTCGNFSQHRSPNRKHDRQYFYKYVSAEVAKIILARKELRWTSPLLFNDPFDVSQELRLNFDEATLNVALNNTDSLRHFRNLVHLEKETSSKFTISKATAKGAVSSIFTIANDF